MGKNKTSFTSDTAPRGGRKKGAKGRTTEEMGLFIKKLVGKNFWNLEGDLGNMSPTNRWIVIQKLTK